MFKNSKKIIIGSRASSLAKKQVEIFKKESLKINKKLNFEIKLINTTADKIIDKKLNELGNKSLFTKEIDQDQIARKIDISIHSLKDLPYNLCRGLKIAGYLKREDCRDVIYSKNFKSLMDIKKNALIGTSSLRREFQLKNLRPDLRFEFIRGNVETRIKKVVDGDYDATILAYAGLKRLGIKDNFFPLEISEMVPAVGQGAIAVVCREQDFINDNLAKQISHGSTKQIVECERKFLMALEGNCETPIGANAISSYNNIIFNYFISDRSGNFFKKDKLIFPSEYAIKECLKLGKSLKKILSKYD